MSPKVSDEHKRERKQEILNAAIEVFKQKGYDAVSMQDVIGHSQTSRGGVYLYFSNKEELFHAVLTYLDEEHHEQYDYLVESTEPARDRIERLLDILKRQLLSNHALFPAIVEYYLNARDKGGKHEYWIQRYQRNCSKITEFLRIGIEKEAFQPTVPVDTIVNFISFCLDGMSLNMSILDRAVDQRMVQTQMESLRHYLRCVLS